jgi:hypothetical protein
MRTEGNRGQSQYCPVKKQKGQSPVIAFNIKVITRHPLI